MVKTVGRAWGLTQQECPTQCNIIWKINYRQKGKVWQILYLRLCHRQEAQFKSGILEKKNASVARSHTRTRITGTESSAVIVMNEQIMPVKRKEMRANEDFKNHL